MTITSSSSYYLVPSTRKSDLKSQMVYTSHAKERTGEREIKLRDGLTLEDILKMPVYTSDNGCIKYLDIEYNIVYYVRGTNIVYPFHDRLENYLVFDIRPRKARGEFVSHPVHKNRTIALYVPDAVISQAAVTYRNEGVNTFQRTIDDMIIDC